MLKIFIVEDDQTIVRMLKMALQNEFIVQSVHNFNAVKQEIIEAKADLVLMDIQLPFFSGFHWTTALREISKLPIIFISSTSDEMDQITAMNQGADDFVTKPFSIDLLKAKITALLRRTYNYAGSEKLTFAGYELSANVLSKGTKQIELTISENKLLTLLFRANGANVTKEKLLETLWDNDEFLDINTLNVKITRLRKKLSPIGFDQHIITKRGIGYALI
ncbi:two-component response regulator [Weissella oryzae SG25]|uniref:Two-component response regulator n=1 Tax=Weissella oryzae (strain DSM 25784 / JCM 18191 / LMG 30913 / SG25) TaxID=1329250 RepID=A0A069CYF9_WEIOS|nr:response regulator transcription factor [Weissella oryzae]GAK30136.1 two-component response regulator [Weissella oryzae SG25]